MKKADQPEETRMSDTDELTRLRALEDRLTRFIGYSKASDGRHHAANDLEFYVVRDHLDEFLTEFAEYGDEHAKRWMEVNDEEG